MIRDMVTPDHSISRCGGWERVRDEGFHEEEHRAEIKEERTVERADHGCAETRLSLALVRAAPLLRVKVKFTVKTPNTTVWDTRIRRF